MMETFENIIFSKYCTPMTRERADANPNLASLGVKSILIDMNQNTTIWLWARGEGYIF